MLKYDECNNRMPSYNAILLSLDFPKIPFLAKIAIGGHTVTELLGLVSGKEQDCCVYNVMGIYTNSNCAVKCKVSKVRSMKSGGEGFVGKCAYTHCNAFDAHLNEQVIKGRLPTTGTFVKLCSLVAAFHIVGMVHFLQIIIATCLLLIDCG